MAKASGTDLSLTEDFGRRSQRRFRESGSLMLHRITDPDTAILQTPAHDPSGTRKIVLHRMSPKDHKGSLSVFATEAASCFWGAHQERWGGRSPPAFPDMLPGGRRQFRPNESAKFGCNLSAPFGTSPFCGHPILVQVLRCTTSIRIGRYLFGRGTENDPTRPL
jgi:hypothetical protein